VAGLKTTYYLRTMGATHAEKTTITDNRLNQVGKGATAAWRRSRPPRRSAPARRSRRPPATSAAPGLLILDPDCEACK